MADFNSYLGVKFKFDSAEARADIVKLLNDLEYFEKKLKNNFDTESIKRWTSAMDTAKQGLYEYGVQVDTVTQQSYQNFRAIGQMDRITREFAAGGLTQGLNGVTMFGNSLTRLAITEGGFKNAISGLASSFMGPAGIVLAVSAAIGIFEQYQKELKKTEQEQENLRKGVAGDVSKIEVLVARYNDSNTSLNERKEIIGKLNSENPEYFGNLNKENTSINELNSAYNDYLNNIQKVLTTRVLEAKLSEMISNRLKYEKENGIELLKSGYRNPEYLKDADKKLEKDKQLIESEKSMAAEIAKMSGVKTKFNTDYSGKDKESEIERQIALTTKWANEEYKLFQQRENFARKNSRIEASETNASIFKDYLYVQNKKEEKKNKTPFDELSKAPELPAWFKEYTTALNQNDEKVKQQTKDYKDFANVLSRNVTQDIMGLWKAMQQGESIGDAIGQMFAKLAEQLAAMVIQAALFSLILDSLGFGAAGASFGDIFSQLLGLPAGKHAEGGITTGPSIGLIGEAGPEAIMPLSKLGNVMQNSFDAGSMYGNVGSNNGEFILRGSDLVLATTRANVNLKYRRG